MDSKTGTALALYERGYTCSQSVLCVFAEEMGLSPREAYKLAEGFGGGMGLMQKECGALTGAYMALSHFTSDGELAGGSSKPETFRRVREAAEAFCAAYGSTDCKSILNGQEPKAHKCGDKVKDAVEIVERILGKEGLL